MRRAALALIAVASCGGKLAPDDVTATPAPVPTSTASPAPTVTSSPVAPPSRCNDLEVAAPIAQETFSATALEEDSGGTVTDGAYDLTGLIVYGVGPGSASSARQTTLEVAGTVLNLVEVDAGTTTSRTTAKLMTAGTTMSLTTLCSYPAYTPAGTQSTYSYTATDTQLTLTQFAQMNMVAVSQVFTKR